MWCNVKCKSEATLHALSNTPCIIWQQVAVSEVFFGKEYDAILFLYFFTVRSECRFLLGAPDVWTSSALFEGKQPQLSCPSHKSRIEMEMEWGIDKITLTQETEKFGV